MNIIEKVLLEWSYRCEKGYPDLNSYKDLAIFESLYGFNLVKELKREFTYLSKEAQEEAKKVAEYLDIPLENIKAHNKNTIILLSDEKRAELFEKLEELGYERDVNIPGSSTGGVKSSKGINIIIKPLSGQAEKSAGKQNELGFINLINKHIQLANQPITVTLESTNNKTLTYQNVNECFDESRADATVFYKADCSFKDKSSKVLADISLKKRNAPRWESSKTRTIGGINPFETFIEKALDDKFDEVKLLPLEQKDKYKLYNPKTEKILSKVVLKDIPENTLDDIVFGTQDEGRPKTIVVKETFEGGFKNYKFENNVLTIKCHLIYTDVDDIVGTDDEPVYAFSNHVGQRYGIEFRAFSKSLLYSGEALRGSAVELKFDDLK